MNKADLIANVADVTSLSRKEAAAAIKAIFEAMTDALSVGDRITLMDFGSFEVHERSARMGRNPKTGEEVKISACKTPAFKAAVALKKRING